MSRLLVGAVLSFVALSSSVALATDARTIRVVPQPFYGATVTLEAGVRVFRPLPPQKYVIVNPGNKTPLNLNLSEINETKHTYNHNDNQGHSHDVTHDGGHSGDVLSGHRGKFGHGRRGGGKRSGGRGLGFPGGHGGGFKH